MKINSLVNEVGDHKGLAIAKHNLSKVADCKGAEVTNCDQPKDKMQNRSAIEDQNPPRQKGSRRPHKYPQSPTPNGNDKSGLPIGSEVGSIGISYTSEGEAGPEASQSSNNSASLQGSEEQEGSEETQETVDSDGFIMEGNPSCKVAPGRGKEPTATEMMEWWK